ncbi:hypothetical protein [Acidovorax phage ACPWH]|nr:hypothetical protein [Acidovorax phage ACPWH]QXV72245.1 hypothetical protein Acf1_00048 [Acidovorax phage ACF1]
MDDADISAARMEAEEPALRAACKKPVGPAPTGRCLYCDEVVGDHQRWCDAGHRDLWTREQTLRGGGR